MAYFGHLDYSDGRHIGGWAVNGDDPNTPIWLEIDTPSGNKIRTRANLPRRDLKKANIGNGFNGFEARLHESDLKGSAKTVVRIAATGEILRQSNKLSLEERFRRATYRLKKQFFSPPTGSGTQAVYATIGRIDGGHIEVWVDHGGADIGGSDVSVMVTVGNIPAWQAPEVSDVSFMSRAGKAYDFYVSGLAKGKEISLWMNNGLRIELCETRGANRASFERSTIKQLARTAAIAREPGAVAVTFWEGGHNPIGRAKVLYDVLDGRRPVVLFAFLFSDFGGDIWPPLTDSNAAIVTIPWSERHFFLRMARQMGLSFDTVWMCKPRMPTFELAAALAAPEAALILDIDDNEDELSASKNSREKAYGRASIGVSRFTMENIPARTAPSVSIQRDFKTHMVRHARQSVKVQQLERAAPIRVGFIGTVRPHNRILEAAEAISTLNTEGQQSFEFHVYGDVQPTSTQDALARAGAVLKDHIPLYALSDHLANFHIVLTGFPSEGEEETPITRYQISSKIGDALSVGRPVLVPAGPSVADLAEVPGVFLFDSATFSDQLAAAAKHVGNEFTLPEEFTLTGAYDGFRAAEKEARNAKPAGLALAHLPAPIKDTATKPTLLLLWKQHDAGLYGRRPDMLARSYTQAFPEHRVVMLEILYSDFDNRYRADHSGLSEIAYLRELNTRKSKTFKENGVEYVQIKVERSEQFNHTLLEYLGANTILPTNTVVVIFPNILHLQRSYDLLSTYTIVTDVVDNQLAWATGNQSAKIIQQYFALCRLSNRVVFNSTLNLESFKQRGLLNGVEDKVIHIPNWYQLPTDFTVPDLKRTAGQFNIFYTGNMNDRIDWDLFNDIAALDNRIRLHLVGEANRSFDRLAELLETHTNAIFHGVKNERMTLQMLCQADLTVMPHVVDKVSKFMNPLKVHMYGALGLPTIASDIPGVVESELLTIAPTREAFLDEVSARVTAGTNRDNAITENQENEQATT